MSVRKFKRKFKKSFFVALIDENPVFVSYLSLCPTLATTNSLNNAIGMGISVLVVLTASNVLISSIRKHTPNEIRIPVYITIIATLVTLITIFLETLLPALYVSLGIYLPLIVVNCLILGRAESFASQNKVSDSFIDGITMGIGFFASLFILAFFRQLLGTGEVFGLQIFSGNIIMSIFVDPIGAFLAFGTLSWIINEVKAKNKKKKRK